VGQFHEDRLGDQQGSQLKTVRATNVITEVNDPVIQGKMDELKAYLTMIPKPQVSTPSSVARTETKVPELMKVQP
jgi:hypothetical protein